MLNKPSGQLSPLNAKCGVLLGVVTAFGDKSS